jgi:hypothetical protein
MPSLRELAFRTLFGWEHGYLIRDNTVMAKPFAAAISVQSASWPGHDFTNGFRIAGIVLRRLHTGFDELRSHKPHGMAMPTQEFLVECSLGAICA